MKYINYIFIALMLFTTMGCEKDTVSYIDPAGEFAANFTFPEGEITAPAKVVLTNRSKYSDKYEWKFQNAKQILKDGAIIEATTSDKLVPDTLFYELPGTYSVTLTAWEGSKSEVVTKEVTIKKMTPKIIVPENIGVYLNVTFSAEAFIYPGQGLTYQWNFGEAGTSTEATPTVKFVTEGEHTVTLTVNDGQETLTTETKIFVLGELTPSLYFTDMITKKLYRYAFKQLSEPTLEAYEVNLGTHPLAMQVYNSRVYIANAGNNLTFSSASADGRLFSVDLKGNDDVTLGKGVGNYAQDPFNFTIDSISKMLFYTTRNNNVRAISLNSRDIDLPATQRLGIVAANAGVSSVFGWVDGGIQIVNNQLWYSKQANGWGLYKFNISSNAFDSRISALDNSSIRNFIVDEVNSKIYFVLNNAAGTRSVGLYKCNFDGSSITLVDDLSGYAQEGSGSEIATVTSMALDKSSDGYLYYAYRSSSDINNTGKITGNGMNSGIKKYKLNGTESPSFLIKGFVSYGIALDYVKR
ncbi:PKD domain-containing protein [Sphingobacterium sp. xlx-130]|uniref:PKD domain-containing protein n=2 Tax=Sphingobacterium TaxID=28453 RepID=UPI001969DE28|nr:PKD domain-containing protein [Sphingobacterium sp. xlx-130]